MKEKVLVINLAVDPQEVSLYESEEGATRRRSLIRKDEVSLRALRENIAVKAVPSEEPPEVTPLIAPLLPLIDRFGSWDSVVVILPAEATFVRTLSVPFHDPKVIQKILSAELSDTLPFDLDEFVYTSVPVKAKVPVNSSLPLRGDELTALLLYFMRKEALSLLLSALKVAQVDPAVVLPCSLCLLPIETQLSEGTEKDQFLLIFGQFPTIVYLKGGKIASLRHLTPTDDGTLLLLEAKAFILSVVSSASAHGSSLEQAEVLLPPEAELHAIAEEILGIRTLSYDTAFKEGTRATPTRGQLTEWAAWYGEEEMLLLPPPTLRVGEFKAQPFRPRVQRGIRKMLPYFFGALLVVSTVLAGLYAVRAHRIAALREALAQELQTVVVPPIQAPSGDEASAVEREVRTLNQQLKELGSPTSASPVDALFELAKEFPSVQDMVIRKIRISQSQVTVEGSAADYSGVDRVERILRKSDHFSRVKKETGSGALGQTDKRGFSFELKLKE